MAKSRFEVLVEQEKMKTAIASMTECPAGDAHQHAVLKGKFGGLTLALDLYRKAMSDDEKAVEHF